MNGRLVFVLGIVLVSSLLVMEVNCECCPPDTWGFCADDSRGTPYCGHGTCNVFGCNCDNGCRKKGITASISDGFVALDLNRDGKVTLGEAKANMAVDDLPRAEEEFARMDLDLDGFLSREEIDS